MSKVFLDTNVLVYTFDHNDEKKRQHVIKLLAAIARDGTLVSISTQVMQEFYNTLTRKLHIAPGEALAETKNLLASEVVVVTPELVIKAAELHSAASITLWDALIVVAAQSAGCNKLWSEDLQNGQMFDTLKVVNPFAAI